MCLAAIVATATAASFAIIQAQSCEATFNAVVCENQLPGNLPSEWDISGAGDSSLQGFATDISVNKGETVRFKVDTTASTFQINIYRLGYYGGRGARKVATIANVPGRSQSSCLTVSATGLIDCGNWLESASWPVPVTAVSGIYLARLSRSGGGASHIVFIVRDDAAQADVLFQTSDTTWQAYNTYGGNSLYVGGPGTNPGRAYKISYNRPFTTRGTSPEDWLFNAEYPMVRWLEANGYSTSYFTGVDTDRHGATELTRHRIFVSVGHDEYWSGPQRTNVEAARGAGVHLAFFSGNEVFWKTRWEASVDGSSAPYRTLVSYKETHANAKIDPQPNAWTGTWRDKRFSPPADGGKPENALTGTLFTVNCCTNGAAITVPQTFASQLFWRNTRIATLPVGGTATLSAGTLGYEWDENVNNGSRPAGLTTLSSTTLSVSQKLLDNGSTYGAGSATHALTLYRHTSGAWVFGAGTVQWSWGLDGNHDRGGSVPDVAMQQATVNLFSDMTVEPRTLQPGLVPGTTSSDTTPPTSAITAPAAGGSVSGATVSVTASATDNIGVAGVQFRLDGNNLGVEDALAPYAISWDTTTTSSGSHSLTAVARDAAGNTTISTPVMVTVTNAPPSTDPCPCTIWSATATPSRIETTDGNAVELGVRFRSDVNGNISGVRFYKGASSTGTHTGSLWSNTGTLLATATFAGETASGWQQVNFSSPVAITANTSYVASYHTNTGQYAVNDAYFATSGVDTPPLHALATGVGTNGVYRYGSSAFPDQTYQGANYWVDVVLAASGGGDATPPTVSLSAPANGATVSGAAVSVTANASDNVGVAGVQFKLDGNNLGVEDALPPYAISWDTTTTGNGTHALTAVARDAAGNASISTPVSVTVSNAPPPTGTCPCTIWPSTAVPSRIETTDTNAVELGLRFRSDVSGTITGVRFYKGASNTGTHTGSLWTNTGTLLATATFTNETASGWQQVNFSPAVAVTANTTYVASYHTNAGQYGVDGAYFVASGVDNTPLHALVNGAGGANGVYRYAASSAFPDQTYQATNYWVDVAFTTSGADTTPPTVAISAPAGGTTVSGAAVAMTANAADNVGVAGVQFKLDGNNLGAEDTASPYSIGWNSTAATNGAHTLTAVARDAAGNTATSAPVSVTVNNAPPSDTTPPTSTMTAPASGATVSGTTVSVTATATDNVGVAGVQFKLDGNNLGAEDTASPYSISWNTTTTSDGSHSLTAVARDAANNTTASAPVTVTVHNAPPPPGVCPCTIWNASSMPGRIETSDTNAVELGVRFRSDSNGTVTGVRFYKGAGNTGTHTGSLWTNTGTLLATATFSNETASGWQQVTFNSPVAIAANTTYVVSYHTNTGQYAVDNGYFTTSGVDNPPLHALATGVGTNGVYRYGASAFPNQTYQAANYWVDLVFSSSTP